jgi:hypothetical protein
LRGAVPTLGRQAGHPFEEALASIEGEHLKVITPWVAGAAEQEDPLAWILEKWGEAVAAHIGAHGYSVCAIPLEGFLGVIDCGGANVTALGVQDQKVLRMGRLNVPADRLKCRFKSEGRKVRNLWLEGAAMRSRGIHDPDTELLNRLSDFDSFKGKGKSAGLGVKTNTEQALTGLPGTLALLFEGHRRIVKKTRVQ